MDWESYKKECYLLSRYKDRYLSDGSFESRTTALIQEGMTFKEQQGIKYMESMMSRDEQYLEAQDRWAPILIYVGDPLCYGVLDSFARNFGEALERAGETVEYYDIGKNDIKGLADFVGQTYSAVIGMQSYAFAVKLGDGTNLHDKIYGPKYNMIFDHPVWMREHLMNGPEDYFVLTHDPNYVSFVKTYFPMIKGCYLLPPAGVLPEEAKDIGEKKGELIGRPPADRKYLLSFVGSYHNWRAWHHQVSEINRKTRGLARVFMRYMLTHRDKTWEDGLSDVLASRGEIVFADGFRDLLFDIKPVCFVVMSYIREKIMDAIARSGMEIHVFGNSWNVERYMQYQNVIRHPDVTPEESLDIYSDSIVSLNIMSWHKGGMTERIANMMLRGAVMATDPSSYIREHYVAGEDYIELDLKDIDSIPKAIDDVLCDVDRCDAMALSAQEKALERETWDDRAGVMLWILCERF